MDIPLKLFLISIVIFFFIGVLAGYFYFFYAARSARKKAVIESIQQTPAESEKINDCKDEFLATISHELRTPLNTIIGFNQCLLMGMDGEITKKQKNSLKHIERAAFYLLHLINDILDLRKAEVNKIVLEISDENIAAFVKGCAEEVSPMANEKNLQINISVDQKDVFLKLDKMRMRQVLLNLLSNAIKFTEKGYISIKVIDYESGVEIQVADSGIGLLPEETSKIFEPFAQANQTITRKYGGTGLGLTIAKKIVELHQGTLRVESVEGVGSTFFIFLPKIQS